MGQAIYTERTPPSAYLLDLDGTLYAGGAAIPGAVDLLAKLRASGTPFRLVTNTTSRSRRLLVERLRGYGFEVEAGEIFTASLAGVALARRLGYSRVAPFVPSAALEDMTELDLIGGSFGRPDDSQPTPPAAVIVGDLGEQWTYALLQEAFEYLMGGAALLALSRDRYWLQGNRLALDAGPFVAALEFATGTTASVAGKPSSAFFSAALDSLGIADPALAAMVGDDLWSDVQGAQGAGLQGWLVRTGKFREDVLRSSSVTPDRILPSIADLV
ncbi:MAG TPA: HAD-IIA family hydrolase [Gemmatimonadales bacterium]|jgi:HAD superfamily hydrolase (TIGR01458 family)